MPTNKKKGKKNARKSSVAAVYCEGCRKKLDREEVVTCVCTRVLFCNSSCQRNAIDSGSHVCPGAPSSTNSYRPGQVKAETGADSHISDPLVNTAWQREYQETIKNPMTEAMLEAGRARQIVIPENPGPDFYAKLADLKDSAACAYMAGIQYKNRMLGSLRQDGRGGLLSQAQGAVMGQIESDELAYKYLVQAAKGGIGIAMVSLSELYEKGQGVRERRITGHDWLWHAVLINSAGAIEMLDSKALLPKEIVAVTDSVVQMAPRIPPFQGGTTGGPHLQSLMASFIGKLQHMNYQFPPFATALPTLTVGNAVRQGTTGRVPLIGTEDWQKLWQITEHLSFQNSSMRYEYGRRGVAKAATAQTRGQSTRRIDDSWLYKVPPEPQCNDQYFGDEVDRFSARVREARYSVNCIHRSTESSNGRVEDRTFCRQCLEQGEERLLAIARGRVVISLYETLFAYGRTVLWQDETGSIRQETFKVYSRGEAELALATLVACEPRLAHPLFVAQDPNFLWPLIDYHGTVRAACEYVAPHVDWNAKLGPVKPPLDRQEIVEEAWPGRIMARCGNNLCTKLEPHKNRHSLSYCSGCQARLYCSHDCLVADWIIHKNECVGGGGKRPPTFDASTSAAEPPQVGEKVIVHGLKAKPEFNGKVGVVRGALTDAGRYPVQVLKASLSASSPLGVKPGNIYQLGVSIHEKPSKAVKYKCSIHQQEVCHDCHVDMTILNHLSKLDHLGQVCTKEQVEEIAETNFAAAPEPEHGEDGTRLGKYNGDYPMHCAGLEKESKRFLLRSLLKFVEEARDRKEPVSAEIAAAINGLLCYSAMREPAARPVAVEELIKSRT